MKYVAVAVCLVAFAALAYAQGATKAQQQQSAGRFQMLISAEGGTAWRIDTVTGTASYCLTAQRSNPVNNPTGREASCSPWM